MAAVKAKGMVHLPSARICSIFPERRCVFSLVVQGSQAMILDSDKIPDGHSVASQAIDLAAFKEDLPPFSGLISCEASIDRSGGTVYIQLRFGGIFKLECSRCLESFDFPIEAEVRLSAKEQPGKAGPALDDESADFFFNTREPEIDLSPAIYEEIMTALPMKPLCRENCPGIETGGGDTGEQHYNPRWEALKKLHNQ